MDAELIEDKSLVHRSGKFLLYYQLEGLCQALRLLAQTGSEPGAATVQLVKAMRESVMRIVEGRCVDVLPEINERSSISDLLATTEVIRTTMLAFLTPDEFEDQQRSFGFARK